MTSKLKRFGVVVLTAPALTLAMSGCMLAGKPQPLANAPLPQAAPAATPASAVPAPQKYEFVSARSQNPRSSRPRPSSGPTSYFGGGGC